MQPTLNGSERIVLDTVRKYNCSNKSKIVEKSNLPWSTVSTALSSLEKYDLITFVDENGKEIVKINNCNAYFIGIAIGTSNIKISVVGLDCELVNVENFIKSVTEEFSKDLLTNVFFTDISVNVDTKKALWCFPTPDTYIKLSSTLSKICSVLLLNAKKCGFDVEAMCFVFPGHIDIRTQTIVHSNYSNLNIEAANIYSILDDDVLEIVKNSNINIFIDHNVKASTVYELSTLSKKDLLGFSGNMAVIYLGMGLGMGMVINNSLYRGENGSNLAGQFGHMLVNRVPDSYIRAYFENGLHNYSEELLNIKGGRNADLLENILREEILYKLIDQKYYSYSSENQFIKSRYRSTLVSDLKFELTNGEPIYKQKFAYYLGTAISNIVKVLSIKNIVFSGKLSGLYPAFKAELQFVLIENKCQTSVNIIQSENGEFSASLGAAELAYKNTFNIFGELE